MPAGHRCTHDTAENCRNDILVTGINRIGPSIRSGPAFCPRVNATPGGSPEILVSSGLQRSIRVKVDHIAQFIIQTRYLSRCHAGRCELLVMSQCLPSLINMSILQ